MGQTGISIELVTQIHDEELIKFGGLSGHHQDKLEGAMGRIDDHIYYNNVDDAFDIAAAFLVYLVKAHAFNDGNKRTALVVCLTYLDLQGITLPRNSGLDDFTVKVAASTDNDELRDKVANCLYKLAKESG